jgi:geranylgeranyl reductase family protein
MAHIYDVLISGAGPAGSIAALHLGRLGYKVLLVDSASFPRDKVCGDVLGPAGLKLLRELHIYERVITEQAYPIHKAQLYGPFGTTISVQFEFQSRLPEIVVMPRKIFDNQLVCAAESAGVQRCTGRVCGLHLSNHGVRVRIRERKTYHEYQARAVIGADGAGSMIARQMGPLPWQHQVIAMRGYLTGITLKSHTVEVYLLPHVWPGYAWLFPLGSDTVNVGLGMDTCQYKQSQFTLHELFEQFLNHPQIKARISKKFTLCQTRAWPVNLGPPVWHRLVGNRCVLTGDAAGLANPMTGGGIINAMISAKIAADVLAKQLPQDRLSATQLQEYVRRVKKLFGKELKFSRALTRIVGISPYFAERFIQRARWTYGLFNHIYHDIHIKLVKEDRNI